MGIGVIIDGGNLSGMRETSGKEWAGPITISVGNIKWGFNAVVISVIGPRILGLIGMGEREAKALSNVVAIGFLGVSVASEVIGFGGNWSSPWDLPGFVVGVMGGLALYGKLPGGRRR